jgi:hypothetical protein
VSPDIDRDIPEVPMKEFIEEPLPPFAWGLADDYGQVGAQLCTRDGRKIGNARVMAVRQGYFHIKTDAGTFLRLNLEELKEFFYKPTLLIFEI